MALQAAEIGNVDDASANLAPASFARDDKARQPRGHLPLPAGKRVKRDPLPVFDTIDEAYRITGRLKGTNVVTVDQHPTHAFFVVKTSPSCEFDGLAPGYTCRL